MPDVRKQLGNLLHHTALKLANLDSRTVLGFYMAPGAFGMMVAKSRLFGITDDVAVSLALASFVYMSMPALWFLMFNVATSGARFRLQILLIVLAIIVISVGLAFWMADKVPMPK